LKPVKWFPRKEMHRGEDPHGKVHQVRATTLSVGDPGEVHLVLDGRRPLLRPDLETLGDERAFVLDARRLTFLSPLDAAGIAALAARGVHGAVSRLLLPTSGAVAGYMDRMDVLAHLPDTCVIVGSPPRGARLDRSDALLELTHVTDADEGEQVSGRVADIASARFDLDTARTVFRAVGELVDNAISHGASSSGAFVAAQTYTGTTSRRPGLEVAICDSGVGVLNHLRRNPSYARFRRPVTAVRYALQPGVTGTVENRGHGLPDALRRAGRDGLAQLVLRSDDALAEVEVYGATYRERIRRSSPSIDGTWAWIRVNLPPKR
jgi:hypothetical protein